MIEALAPVPRTALVARGELQITTREIDADGVPEDVLERAGGRDVGTTARERDDELDLVVEVARERRVRDASVVLDASNKCVGAIRARRVR